MLDKFKNPEFIRDYLENPKFAILIVRSYCFISGQIDKNLGMELILLNI